MKIGESFEKGLLTIVLLSTSASPFQMFASLFRKSQWFSPALLRTEAIM